MQSITNGIENQFKILFRTKFIVTMTTQNTLISWKSGFIIESWTGRVLIRAGCEYPILRGGCANLRRRDMRAGRARDKNSLRG